MGKIIEGLWDCPFCGNKRIRAGQKTCPDCGHPQDENTKFYMPDEIKYVSEEEAEKISRNPDWQCSFCGSLNSDDLNVCKNCGATKEDSERNYFEMRQQEGCRIVTFILYLSSSFNTLINAFCGISTLPT